MRHTIKIPRILKINWIRGLAISVVFNNGESRIVDFRKLLIDIGTKDSSPASILFDSIELSKVELNNNTLSWSNVEQYISSKNGGKIKVPFEIGADVLLKYSQTEKSETSIRIGKMIRDTRIKTGISQQELALISGTSRTYISRIENDRSDIELATLRKIIETGLGRKMEIRIK
jgi:DNA-binding XRE family transcriptional regulator